MEKGLKPSLQHSCINSYFTIQDLGTIYIFVPNWSNAKMLRKKMYIGSRTDHVRWSVLHFFQLWPRMLRGTQGVLRSSRRSRGSTMLQVCFQVASSIFPVCFKYASRMLQFYFKQASSIPQVGFKQASSRIQVLFKKA